MQTVINVLALIGVLAIMWVAACWIVHLEQLEEEQARQGDRRR